MKISKQILFSVICLIMGNTMWSVAKDSVSDKTIPTSSLKAQQLKQIFQTDNLAAFQTFHKKNPKFNWQSSYFIYPKTDESGTPLNAAASVNAVKCIKYLLKNIKSANATINTASSHGYTVLDYADMFKNTSLISWLKTHAPIAKNSRQQLNYLKSSEHK